MEFITEQMRKIEVIDSTEVLVVGGGPEDYLQRLLQPEQGPKQCLLSDMDVSAAT